MSTATIPTEDIMNPVAELEKTDISISDYSHIVDPNEATWAYLNALENDDWRAEVFLYVRAAMVGAQRASVLSREDEAFGRNSDGPTAERPAAGLLANRLVLLNQTFSLADGTRVEWLKATPAQHLERAEMQRRLAGKCLVDVERHEQAAKLIKKFKVTCLAEIQS